MENSLKQYNELFELANQARLNSYCPYSHFAVGAALLCKDGTVYVGMNIENASYTPTVCAERVAFFRAIADGKRDFLAIAIVGGPFGEEANAITAPCGVCRQVMSEFAGGDFKVILSGGDKPTVYTLSELLPCSFDKASLARAEN